MGETVCPNELGTTGLETESSVILPHDIVNVRLQLTWKWHPCSPAVCAHSSVKMGYPTAATMWPTPEPSKKIKDLVDLFFTLADTKDDNAGERLATKVFAEDAVFSSARGVYEGSKGINAALNGELALMSAADLLTEISNSRKDTWAKARSRRHEVLKVYENDTHGMDIIIIGELTAESLDGSTSTHGFVARMFLNEGKRGAPKVQQYRVLVPATQDPRPILSRDSKG